jgi:DNA invertase Pin-like site-specific DNA recombinase
MTKRRPADSAVAVAYLRVSTDRQELGPEVQRAAIEKWAAANGITVVSWHLDKGVSGATEPKDRPALVAALGAMREAAAGVLVVSKRDRLSRDVLASVTLERLVEKMGARIVAADGMGNGDTPEAELMRHMLGAFAQFERQLIGSRTASAVAVKRARGQWWGGKPPYGQRVASDGKTLEPHPEEQAVVTMVRELRARGARTSTILTAVNAAGHLSRAGKPFARTQIVNMAPPVADEAAQ